MGNGDQTPKGEGGRDLWVRDILSIQQVLARYVPAFDGSLGASVAADFTEDGVLDISGIGVFEGRDQITSFVTGLELAAPGGHFLSSPMIEIDGDTATATLTSLFFYRDQDLYHMPRLTAVRVELVRAGGAWKIARRFNRVIDDAGTGVALYRRAFGISDGN